MDLGKNCFEVDRGIGKSVSLFCLVKEMRKNFAKIKRHKNRAERRREIYGR